MSSREFLTSATVVVAIMAVLAAIEVAVPLFPRTAAHRGRSGANVGLMAITFAMNWGLMSAAALLAITRSPGIMATFDVPLAARIVLGVVALDLFFGYLAHVALHAIPWLWRVHRVHHSDPFVDVTTTYRTHPLESVWRFLFMMVPVWLLSVPAEALVVYRLLSALNGLLEHANIRIRSSFDTALSCVWVTPNMHKIHHSRDRMETNSNYGNLLSLHDRIFRTFIPTDRAPSVVYGLDDTDPGSIRSLPRLLSMRTSVRDRLLP